MPQYDAKTPSRASIRSIAVAIKICIPIRFSAASHRRLERLRRHEKSLQRERSPDSFVIAIGFSGRELPRSLQFDKSDYSGGGWQGAPFEKDLKAPGLNSFIHSTFYCAPAGQLVKNVPVLLVPSRASYTTPNSTGEVGEGVEKFPEATCR